MDLLIATNNAGKAREIKAVLSGSFDSVYTLKEKNIAAEPEETGADFFENAMIKAKAASRLSGLTVLADDSGLSVDSLCGAPGVYSARYAGPCASDSENCDKLLKEMENIKDRGAHFTCVVVLLSPDGSYISAGGETYGEITRHRTGKNGFGYDSCFYSYDLKKTFGEASEDEKNIVSHRARALSELKKKITRGNPLS